MAGRRAPSVAERPPGLRRVEPTRRTPRLRRTLLGLALLLLLAPTALIAAYRVVPPPVTPLMLIRLAEGDGLRRHWVPLERISPHLAQAVVAGEDNLFCRHAGFDWKALRGQVEAALAGERARGASTITMQTAKNILLWPGRDLARKALEAWLTPQLELLWGKRRIVEVYLNAAEMGRGIFGAEAAAQAYFGKPAEALTKREAARLAAILPNPREWSPVAPAGSFVEGRARTLAARIDQLGPLLDCVQ